MTLRILLLLSLAVPGVELLSIALVAAFFGWLLTIALLIIGALAGLSLLKHSGRQLFESLRSEGSGSFTTFRLANRLPRTALAGILFIIPGFLSDIIALFLLATRNGAGGFTRSGPRTHDTRTIDLEPSSYRHIDGESGGRRK